MPASESSSDPEQPTSESSLLRDTEEHSSTRPEWDPTRYGRVEQSVLKPPGLDGVAGPARNALVGVLARIAPNDLEVHQALEDLRSMIEETVRREVRTLAKEMNANFEAIEARFEAKFEAGFKVIEARLEAVESQLKMMRWMMSVMITLNLAVLALLVGNLFYDRPSGTPIMLPPGTTLQVPAGTVTAQPVGSVRVTDPTEPAQPVGTAAATDPPADQTAP